MKKNYSAALRLFATLFTCILLTGLVRPGALCAQTYAVPSFGSNSVTTCGGTLYDDGGLNGLYSANANGTITITPATAGNKIRLQFTSFQVETGYDAVSIYDGANTNAPLIGTYDSSNPPTTVYGTSTSGALTVRLASDGIVQQNGFSASIACVTSVPPPAQSDLAIQGALLSPLSVVAGGGLTASCTVYNLAGAIANNSSVGYYLSADAVLDGNDQLLGNSTGFPLPAGQSSSRFANFTMPAGTAPGNYYVLFVVDYLNQVSESNKANNVASVNMTVTPPSIDLTIQQASVNPQNVTAGSPLTMNCNIANQGNATATSSSVGFYFSTNATLDAADQLLTSQYGGQLTPSFPATRNGTAAVPPGLTPGTYYILFVADFQNQVGETNENNNVVAVSFTVALPGVDLVVQQEQLYQNPTVAGNQVQLYATMVNQGNTAASSSTVGYYLSTNQTFDAADVLLSSSVGGFLIANQLSYRSASPLVPAGTVPGTYYVLFVADPANAVTETNENNNVRSLLLTVVAPSIDLQMQNASLGQTSSAPGGIISATCSLFNQGNAQANPATVGYYLSTNQTLDASDVLLSNTTGSLFGGSFTSRYANITVPTGTALGNYYVLFVADYQNQLSETNENNNVASTPLQVVAPGIDLLIQQPSLGSGNVTPGFAINSGCSILNTGNTVSVSSTVGYYLSTNQTLDASDVLLNTVTGFALAAGQSSFRSTSLVVPTGTVAGNYYVLFVADPQSAVAETNENNNVASQALTVNGPFVGTLVPLSGSATITTCATTIYDNGGYNNYADYSNGTLTILPATPGALVQLVFNSFSTEPGFDYVRIYDGTSVNAPLLASYTGYQLPPLVMATNASGALTVQFTSDGSATSTGFDATVSCGAAPQSDLLLTQIGASPSSVAVGGNLSLSGIVANQGGGAAPSSAVGYYLSTNQTLDASDRLLGTRSGGVLGVNLDETRQLVATVPSNVTPGAYYVLFVADPANVVSETNEGNNLAALAVTVTQPLASRDQTAGYTVSVAPNPVVAGSTLRVLLRGAGASCAASVDLYNALGQRVRTEALQVGAGRANQAEIMTQHLATGVYTLRLTGTGLSVTRRIVIE
ncbi:MAG TPA: CARDB domain-containing protein [Hymenobacter sp.]|jgi:subtilase family serine protease|uniref:CARDB domain-containing protein n=1 Tax=Hymenobacter sp. TaxID=1898978 RepID=UPI002ED7DF23